MQFKDPYKKEEIEDKPFEIDGINNKFDEDGRFPRFF